MYASTGINRNKEEHPWAPPYIMLDIKCWGPPRRQGVFIAAAGLLLVFQYVINNNAHLSLPILIMENDCTI